MTKTDAALSVKDKFPKLANSGPAPDTNAPEDQSDTTLVILPDPVGHKMLVALPTMAERTAGGIIIPHATNERERAATVVGTVLAMGDTCYNDIGRFGVYQPDGSRKLGKPWCKVGDTVLFTRYAGMRFKTKDVESGEMVEYRIMNDDEIAATVPAGAEVGAL